MANKTVKAICYESVLHGEDHHCKILADDVRNDRFRDHKLRNFRQVHLFVKELWPQLRDDVAKAGGSLCVLAPYSNVLFDLEKAMRAQGDLDRGLYCVKRFEGGKGTFPRLVIARRKSIRGKGEHAQLFDQVCFLPIADRVDCLGVIGRAFCQAQELSQGVTWVIGSTPMLEKLGITQSAETEYKSIFDYATPEAAALDGQTKPETCFRKALESERVRELLCSRSIAVFSELPLSCLMVAEGREGKAQPLPDYLRRHCGDQDGRCRFAADLARFDFAFVTRSQPHRLLLVVEIDGEQHRYGWNGFATDSLGAAKEAIEKSLKTNEDNDCKKNSIIELLGGTVLSRGQGAAFAANDEELLAGTLSVPVLYRLPTNGSSAFEVESLKSGANKAEAEYFTLEELIARCADAACDDIAAADASQPRVFVQDLPGISEEKVYGEGGLGFSGHADALRWLEEKGFIERAETAGWLPSKHGEAGADGIRMGIAAMLFIEDSGEGEAAWMCRFSDHAVQRLSEWGNRRCSPEPR